MKEFKLTISSLGYVISELTKIITSVKDKAYRITIKEWKESRSLSQNALYWCFLAEIDKQHPLSVKGSNFGGSELWHEVFKKYYCPSKVITNGKINLETKSTKLLDVGEFTFYLNKIENWCMDRGIKLTIPENSDYARFMGEQIE